MVCVLLLFWCMDLINMNLIGEVIMLLFFVIVSIFVVGGFGLAMR